MNKQYIWKSGVLFSFIIDEHTHVQWDNGFVVLLLDGDSGYSAFHYQNDQLEPMLDFVMEQKNLGMLYGLYQEGRGVSMSIQVDIVGYAPATNKEE